MRRRLRTAALLALGSPVVGHLLPSVATVPAVHRLLLPWLSGQSQVPHVALTFDDGPDAESTPRFLDALERLDARATFFVLGSQVERHPDVARRIVAEGHELAVHDWLHRPHLLRPPWRIRGDLLRSVEVVARTAGVSPRFARPPNGVVTGAGLRAASRLDLRTVLWTADGRDWQASATPASVLARVVPRLGAGGVVLLHDCDVTSAPQSWHAGLGALPELVGHCRRRGWEVGPLHEHWSRQDS